MVILQGAAGVLFNEDLTEILVIIEDETNDSYGKEAGMLSIPMGTIKPNEEPEKTIVRELSEETGYSGKISHFLGVFPITGFEAEVSAYIIEPVNGFRKTSKAELKSSWISLEALISYPFVRPPTKEILLSAVRFLRHKKRISC
ncbi:MAG: hypothetical protein A2896_02790 [Candidatus Nealsonbacteria bacterium RIFCSPLOWO2_01_FULL_43_32]|uniref:Nudix hydrolase domain-containing protein n=1 Tax=Candidatus Nealsonbacteria bacterium RIFCSPLOWO2_01_FULL_43_32 TaxID=1801672 RepID=A0A1G2EEB4_9BACT|nr:MAG: hypothetical protein A2896_02790 [Candidatus Nealsonbacteria bacterium RIFCSPLOWO2_01_FULL_43_32]